VPCQEDTWNNAAHLRPEELMTYLLPTNQKSKSTRERRIGHGGYSPQGRNRIIDPGSCL